MKLIAIWFVCLSMLVSSAYGFTLDGIKELKLIENDGTAHVIATVNFSSQNGKTNYSVNWNDEAFGDHFLSMRPFKCIESKTKHWCRVPYPYDIKRTVSATDLTDLEYDTLFVWKGPLNMASIFGMASIIRWLPRTAKL